MLADCEVEHLVLDIEVHAFFVAAACAFATVLSCFFLHSDSSAWIERLIKFEADSLSPSIMEVVLHKDLEGDEAVVAEIGELDFEEVPVVEGEVVGIDFFVEGQPGERGG